MESALGTGDRMVDQLVQPPEEHTGPAVEPVSEATVAPSSWPLFPPPPDDGAGGAHRPDGIDEGPGASLAGSLSVFTLSDALSMLASTLQTGELHVVGESVDGRVWLDRGELLNAQVGSASTIGQAIFELACLTEGRFFFRAGAVSTNGQASVPVGAVLTDVRPQVDEWREILAVVPLDAVVGLCPDPPGQDVQIRADQWRALTAIGAGGLTVRAVLDIIGGTPVTGLRTIRDLRSAGLIDLTPATDGWTPEDLRTLDRDTTDATDATDATPPPPPDPGTEVVVDDVPDGALPGFPSPDETPLSSSLAEVTIMPPPIAGDPWAPSHHTLGSEANGVA